MQHSESELVTRLQTLAGDMLTTVQTHAHDCNSSSYNNLISSSSVSSSSSSSSSSDSASTNIGDSHTSRQSAEAAAQAAFAAISAVLFPFLSAAQAYSAGAVQPSNQPVQQQNQGSLSNSAVSMRAPFHAHRAGASALRPSANHAAMYGDEFGLNVARMQLNDDDGGMAQTQNSNSNTATSAAAKSVEVVVTPLNFEGPIATRLPAGEMIFQCCNSYSYHNTYTDSIIIYNASSVWSAMPGLDVSVITLEHIVHVSLEEDLKSHSLICT